MAMDVADMTLVHRDLELLPRSIVFSRRTVGIIQQNHFWAFIYNVIGFPQRSGYGTPSMARL